MFGGIRPVTNVAFSYERQLNLEDRLSVSGRYGRIGQSKNMVLSQQPKDSELFGLSGTYSKAVNERFSLFVAPSFTKVVESSNRNESNYSITVGIKLKLGKLR